VILFRDLNLENKKLLTRISSFSKFSQVRSRAKCILLLDRGFSIPQLMKIFGVSRKTIYNWLTKWEEQGFSGLDNHKGRGRKSKLNEEQKTIVKEWVKQEPKSLNKVVAQVDKEWSIELSKETIKRIIKKLKMKWKRMKRGLSKIPDEWELEFKIPELLKLKEQDKKGEIDLRYLDESGFSLTPSIPYAWQEQGITIALKSCQSKRVNVLGLMNRRNELFYEIYSENVNSKMVIDFLDNFSQNLTIPTVIVMDQASIHTSDSLLEKLEEWSQKNLRIFWLPTYSPKQNLIEILWKFIKYEWIEIDAYSGWTSLLNYLKKVLNNFGKKYVINFV
jgi:transposase